MTRDSNLWPIGMIGAFCAALAVNPDLVEGLLERDTKAIASVICMLLAIVAGWMNASPINALSDEGRAKYLSDRVKVK